ncbi:MAG: hypothetical protein K9G46_13545 [Flavobacteriales bacterium]|nr:hypothetical protein [Flavobacteriales bacterium]
MVQFITLLLLLLFVWAFIKGFAIEQFLIGTFVINLAIDLVQFEEISSLVAALRAAYFYFFFAYFYLKYGIRKIDVPIIILFLYALVGVLQSSDLAHSFRFMLRVFVPLFLLSMATRDNNPVKLLSRLRIYLPWFLVVVVLYTLASNYFSFGVETYGASIFLTGYLYGADLHLFSFIIIITMTTRAVVEDKVIKIKVREIAFSVLTLVVLMFSLRRTSLAIVIVGIVFLNITSFKNFGKKFLPLVVLLLLVGIAVVKNPVFQQRMQARANKFSVESLEDEARYLEIDVIRNEVLSFRKPMDSFFGKELFNSMGNYGDGKFKGRMIHVDYFTWLHGGGVLGLLLYLLFLFSIPVLLKVPFFTSNTSTVHLRLFWFLWFIQFIISVSGQMYIISFRSFIFIYLALTARAFHQEKSMLHEGSVR